MKESAFTRIYEIVQKIPAGSVATYGQIAMLAGMPRGARVVGTAMHLAPAARKLPCHRVLNRLGELSPDHAFGGQANQRMLLEMEGITFLDDGRANLKKHIWAAV